MKTSKLIMAAGVVSIFASTGALAYDPAQYASLKNGQANCSWCDLSGANLSDTDLSGADLSGANLTGADLSGAVLTSADLSGADLTGAVVAGTDFTGSRLTGANLDQVDLSNAKLAGAAVETAYCDWATRFPDGSTFVCKGVTVQKK